MVFKRVIVILSVFLLVFALPQPAKADFNVNSTYDQVLSHIELSAEEVEERSEELVQKIIDEKTRGIGTNSYGEEWTLVTHTVLEPMQPLRVRYVDNILNGSSKTNLSSSWNVSAGTVVKGVTICFSFNSRSSKHTFNGPTSEIIRGTNFTATHAFITSATFGEIRRYLFKIENRLTGQVRYEFYTGIVDGGTLLYRQLAYSGSNFIVENPGRTNTKTYSTHFAFQTSLNNNITNAIFF